MPRLPTILIYPILATLSLACCDHQVQYRQIPFAVQQYFMRLPAWEKPKKVQLDPQHRKVYWLNQKGEIHAIRADGSREELVNPGIGATLGITYIDDFTLDSRGNTIYFTDLMDIGSGFSAVKRSDLQGENIQVVATFPAEIPYAVAWDTEAQQLYYLTKREKTGDYSLQLLGRETPLAISGRKISDISVFLREHWEIQAVPGSLADQSAPVF